MGIEVPEQYGGAGGSLMMVTLAVEEISKVDRRRGDPDATCRTRSSTTRSAATAATHIKAKYLPRLTADTVGAYALSRAGSGSDAFGIATRAEQRGDAWILNGRKMWITNGAEAEIYVVFANANPSAGYKGITAFIVERELHGLLRRQEGGQARHPRVEHDGADPRRRRGAGRERARPRGPGLQDRDRDAERGTHRHRRADDRRGAGRARARRPTYVKERTAVRQAARRVPGHPVPARAGAHGARGRAADGVQRGAAQGRRPRHRDAKARWRSCSRRRSPSA